MDVAELVNEGIAAFFPIYDGGNVTCVLTRSGKQLPIRRTCKTVLKNLARFYNIDLTAIREYYGKAVNKKQGVPIPMTTNLLLIPVKARKNPLGENDGTFGYVNFREIKQLADGAGGSCHIIFQSDKKLEVLVSKVTMKEYVKNAQLVESIFLNRHFDGYKGANKSWGKLNEYKDKYIATLNEEKGLLSDAESSCENEEDLLREYLLKLLLEIIHLIHKQKNQAAE